jgi:hypothetical protein
LAVCLSIYLSTHHLSSIHPSIHPSIIHPQSTCFYVHAFTSVCLSIYLSIFTACLQVWKSNIQRGEVSCARPHNDFVVELGSLSCPLLTLFTESYHGRHGLMKQNSTHSPAPRPQTLLTPSPSHSNAILASATPKKASSPKKTEVGEGSSFLVLRFERAGF